MNKEDSLQILDEISVKDDLRRFVSELRVFASNNKFEKSIIELIEKTIEKAKIIDDIKSLVDLYEIKISQIEHLYENIDQISEMMLLMRDSSLECDYMDGLALSYNIEWYIEKFKGNKTKSRRALDYSIKVLSNHSEYDEYSYFICHYSYAFEQWTEENDPESAVILEECANFFLRDGYYRSLVQSLAVLFVIYQETQNRKSALKATQKLLSSKIPFDSLPHDIQAISYYFVGLSHKLQLNLSLAEEYLEKAKKILKETLEKSIYSFYYIPVLSHLSTVLALQGKMEQALELNKEAESLLRNKLFSNNFDSTSRRQIKHSYSLVKFYVKSRINSYTIVEITELIDNIYNNIKINYSNAIMLTEFLLSSNLNSEQLIELRNTNNASLERVRHIINFLIEKSKFNKVVDEKHSTRCIEVLQNTFRTKKYTFIEKAYIDLLIVKQLFSLKRFSEIHPLLKNYESRISRIEVLEMQIFMQAFIQVGKFKNGDPLAPAMHFMAIKRCRVQQFSRLEGILLEQQKNLQNIAMNSIKIKN